MASQDGEGHGGTARGVPDHPATLPCINTNDRNSSLPAVALAEASTSQQYVTQPSQTVPALGVTTDLDMKQSSNKRKVACGGGGVPDWVLYDADIVDNVAKTRRFTSECISDDLVSRLAMSMSEDGNEAAARPQSCLVPSPSPQSKHTRPIGPCPASFSTPTKSKREAISNSLLAQSAVPAKLFEAELTVTTSPSDVLMHGGGELRKTALVRLALRNSRHTDEMDS